MSQIQNLYHLIMNELIKILIMSQIHLLIYLSFQKVIIILYLLKNIL